MLLLQRIRPKVTAKATNTLKKLNSKWFKYKITFTELMVAEIPLQIALTQNVMLCVSCVKSVTRIALKSSGIIYISGIRFCKCISHHREGGASQIWKNSNSVIELVVYKCDHKNRVAEIGFDKKFKISIILTSAVHIFSSIPFSKCWTLSLMELHPTLSKWEAWTNICKYVASWQAIDRPLGDYYDRVCLFFRACHTCVVEMFCTLMMEKN